MSFGRRSGERYLQRSETRNTLVSGEGERRRPFFAIFRPFVRYGGGADSGPDTARQEGVELKGGGRGDARA